MVIALVEAAVPKAAYCVGNFKKTRQRGSILLILTEDGKAPDFHTDVSTKTFKKKKRNCSCLQPAVAPSYLTQCNKVINLSRVQEVKDVDLV